MKRLHMWAACLALLTAMAGPALGFSPKESTALSGVVAAGNLPPVAERAPSEPLVVDLAAKGREAGVQGGVLRTIFTRAKDIRYMVVYGYARLVGYDADYELVPDILRAVEVEEGRRFTMHLREGHKWSDGAPFTTEDFRYWWEDVANNPLLAPSGPPELMVVDGVPATLTVVDETTMTWEWPAPNPRFLPALAQARPPFIYRPAHYMKAFHETYADTDALAAQIREARARNWAQLHNKTDQMYKFDNPALPTLQPWMNTSDKNGQRYVLARNPYYHRFDQNGVQLPYIDGVDVAIAAGGLVASKVTLGESDLQVRSLGFSDAPVLKKGEKTGGYDVRVWSNGAAAEIALYPNLNYTDPGFRALFREADFRRALSLGIDRKAINKSLYYGLAKERAMAPLEQSPFFNQDWADAWAAHDPDRANDMLDALGLDKRDGDGVRLLPDGRRLEIVVESAGERGAESDALELVAEAWRDIGVRLIYRPVDRDILRNAAYRGEAMMPVWFGWNNGIPTADAPPRELAPVDQANFSWPMWGQHFQTQGAAGQPPETAEAQRLLALFNDWNAATETADRAAVWRKMLAIHADQVFGIGLVSGAPQPAAVSKRLRNVPAKAIWAWDPGAHLGVHRMDEFWFAE
ncbi:ABC transporter substrate-binding protein [Rhodovulum sp. DZ06]|uniref:ABC transporter substrate-binding protein n=1 Tax=Rhodovulum sp. DZ06 TaxID=3425126 RepID=UPI003D3337E3